MQERISWSSAFAPNYNSTGLNLKSCNTCTDCYDCVGCYNCKHCKNCCGCYYLEDKQFYINDRQYSPQQYFALKEQLGYNL